jgi:hypothetical protein
MIARQPEVPKLMVVICYLLFMVVSCLVNRIMVYSISFRKRKVMAMEKLHYEIFTVPWVLRFFAKT